MNNPKNFKTEYIHIRVDSATKGFLKETAGKYFGCNVSLMLRYLVHAHDFRELVGKGGTPEENPASVSEEQYARLTKLLKETFEMYRDTRNELSAIGNNLNQIAHQVNARSLTGANTLMGRADWEALRQMKSDLHLAYVNLGCQWKSIRKRML